MSPDRRAPADAVSDLEEALSHLQCVLVARRAAANPEGVTWAQYDVLETLHLHGPMQPSQIGVALGISRPSISKLLRVLKELDLIRQTPDPHDGRVQRTTLTPTGERFLERQAQSRRSNARRAATALTPREQVTFAALCHKAAQALDLRSGNEHA